MNNTNNNTYKKLKISKLPIIVDGLRSLIILTVNH
jgi:hypothetical protein